MTSKEIFRNIVDGLEDLLQSLYNSLLSKERKEQCKQIENDLEVLEILRKHLTTIQITGLGTEKYKDIVVIPYEDEKDAEIVRKWLEKNG